MLRLTKREMNDFCRTHRDAMLFFMWASNDYISARCCMLNHLATGFRLASEAIEKLLKSAICFESGVKPRGNNALLHSPYALKEKLKEHKDYGLDMYDIQLKKLTDHYIDRYHDNVVTGEGISSNELKEIDEIWVAILELLPIPKEVLYRSFFFTMLFNDVAKKNSSNNLWITKNNQALAHKLNLFQSEYDESELYYESLI